MPADLTAFLLMGTGAVLILVGYSSLHDELNRPGRGLALALYLLWDRIPMAFLAIGIMLLGGFLLYLGWNSLT
jgi:hypothetical protein